MSEGSASKRGVLSSYPYRLLQGSWIFCQGGGGHSFLSRQTHPPPPKKGPHFPTEWADIKKKGHLMLPGVGTIYKCIKMIGSNAICWGGGGGGGACAPFAPPPPPQSANNHYH